MDTSLLPRGEELHATLCLGMVEDQASLAQEAAEVFHLDHDLQPEEGATYTDYTPVFLFLWRSKMALFLRSKQLLCETYQGRTSESTSIFTSSLTRVECAISTDNTDTMELELCLDDHLEIDTATVIRDQRLLEVRLPRKISHHERNI